MSHATSAAPAPVAVRPFAPDDFDRIVALMPPEWLFEGMSSAEALAQRRMDCAGMLGRCNLRLVAVTTADDGNEQLLGLLLARVADLPAPVVDPAWPVIETAARKILEHGGPQARQALAYVEQLDARGELIIREAGDRRGPDNELELFVVGPQARGKGAGGALMTAFEHTLRELGAPSYWLQTDSTCTWQWYEKHGYIRVADVELGPAFPMPVSTCADAEHPASTPHVFMYRKDLA